MAKIQKRKPENNVNGPPQNHKKFKKDGGPNKVQKSYKNPNNKNAFKSSPKGVKFADKKDPSTAKPAKLEMFSGTTALDLSAKSINSKPDSMGNKKQQGNVKGQANTKLQHAQSFSNKKKGNTPESSKKEVAQTSAQANATGGKPNRHKRRRTELKGKRQAARQKLNELRVKVLQGDKAALSEVQEKLTTLESLPNIGKAAHRRLNTLRNLISRAGSTATGKLNNKQENKQSLKNQKKTQLKNQTNQNQLAKVNLANKKLQPVNAGQKGKQKPSVKVEAGKSESDEDSEEESNDEDMDELSENGEDEEEIEKDAEEEDDDESSNDDDDENEEQNDSSDEEEVEAEESSESDVEMNLPKAKGKKENAKKPENNVQAKNVKKSNASPANLKEQLLKDKMSRYVVFVGNLPFTVEKDGLKEHFKKVGEIVDIRIPLDEKTKKSKGFAYVELNNEESYQKALSLHHTFVSGRRINVMYTKGGKKQSEKQKNEVKAKNLKLQAMRQQGLLAGSVKADNKRSVRRAKKKSFGAKGDN